MIPDDLQSAAASSLERSESVAPTYVANGVLEGESPRDRANTDESLTIRGRSDSETVAAKLKIEIVEPDETSVSTDVEDSPRSVDSEDAADMIAGAVRPRKNTLTIDDVYDRASDNEDEDSEEDSEKHSGLAVIGFEGEPQESEEESSESVVSAPAENAEGSTSGQPEGAEETHAEETADEQPSSDEARSGPEEEHAQEGENLKETAPESPEKSSSIASSGTDTSMGSVPDTWSPDIPRNDPKKLMRLQSDSF